MLLQRRSNTASRMDDYVAEEKRDPEKRPKCHRCRVSTAGGSRKIARLHGVCFDFPVILKGIKNFEKKQNNNNKKTAPSHLHEVSVQSERDCVPLRDCVSTSGTLDSA